jgi:4-aminobutyrate aminotransferase
MSAAEAALIELDEKVSFTQANSSPALMSVAAASGVWITDASGRKYIDFYGNNCHHVGYQHPRVVAKVREQLDRYSFVPRGLTGETSIRLPELLIANYPEPSSKVLFVPGGAAAVELALMIAKVHTRRFKTISFWDSYHGRSAGALSVGGTPRDRSPRMGPLMPGALHALPFYWHARKPSATKQDVAASAQASLDSISVLFESEKDIAALIAEPIRNGPYVPPEGYWSEVRSMCDRYGALLIFDEIPTGLGKTGRLFNSEHFGVLPDMTLLGKALGGAIAPLAAVIANAALDTAPELNLSYFTHEKNALSAAAGLGTLSVILDEKLPERARALGAKVASRLAVIQAQYKVVANVRCAGLMFAVDFADSGGGRTGTDRAQEAYFAVLRRGLLAMNPKGHTLSFSSPLVISEQELDNALHIVEAAIQSLS